MQSSGYVNFVRYQSMDTTPLDCTTRLLYKAPPTSEPRYPGCHVVEREAQ